MLFTLFVCFAFIEPQNVIGKVKEGRLVGGLLLGSLDSITGSLGSGGAGGAAGAGGAGKKPPPASSPSGVQTAPASFGARPPILQASGPLSSIDYMNQGILTAIAALRSIIQNIQNSNKPSPPASAPSAIGQPSAPSLSIVPPVLTGRLKTNDADTDAINIINRSAYYLKLIQINNPECQKLSLCGGAHTLKRLNENLSEYSEPLQMAITTVMKAIRPLGVTDEALNEKATDCYKFLLKCPEAMQISKDDK